MGEAFTGALRNAGGLARRRNLRGWPQERAGTRALSSVVISMSAEYLDIDVRVQEAQLKVSLTVRNKSRETWNPENFSLAWQFFDPQIHRFIEEGTWMQAPYEVRPGASAKFEISIPFPSEAGAYEIYISHLQPRD